MRAQTLPVHQVLSPFKVQGSLFLITLRSSFQCQFARPGQVLPLFITFEIHTSQNYFWPPEDSRSFSQRSFSSFETLCLEILRSLSPKEQKLTVCIAFLLTCLHCKVIWSAEQTIQKLQDEENFTCCLFAVGFFFPPSPFKDITCLKHLVKAREFLLYLKSQRYYIKKKDFQEFPEF